MSDSSKPPITLPREQQAIRGKCFHPSGTFVEFPKEEIEQSIPARFEKIVRMYPDRLAVKMGDRALTYDQLNQAANRIAHAILKRLGLGSEPIVLLFEQGIDVIAAVLGVLKTGKFYVALDVSSPEERNASIVSDTGATLILTSSRNRDSAHKLAGTRGCVLYCDQIGAATSSENLAIAISQDGKTTISYTSGSTGAPKGVIETHRFRPHDALIYTHAIRISPDDRLSLLHSVSFGTAATNLYQSLLNGASLFPFDLKSEGINRLADWLKEEQITILHSPVASFREFALALSASDKFPRLRAIHLSGSSITQLDVNLYKSKLTERTSLVFHFGATEAGAIAMAVVDPTFSYPSSGTPAGYPLPGKQLMLLNEHNQEVGFGEIGEIAVKSPYLARGYWKNPQLTGAKFLLNPDGGVERTYLTGDLGRLRPDGFLIHLGRKDLMVKIRGYRVEIGEIERTLLSHPLIKDVGVVAWDREPEEKYLVGYVVARYPSAVTVSDLRNFLRNQLPDYMIPRIFVFLDSLPLTNGKLDRGALPKPEGQRPELGQAYGAPQSEIERTIASIWEEVLNIRPIGIHDNLFDLGGHSLSASQIVSRVIETFRLEVPLQKLFESPTVAQMAGWITEHPERMRREEDGVPVGTGALSLRPVPRDKELPLSFAQHRLWLLNQLEPDSPVYNEPKTVRFRGVLDVESLQKTLDTIMERHEVLRTTFSSVDGKPKQVIHTGARLDPRFDRSDKAYKGAAGGGLKADPQRVYLSSILHG